ncbi:MAG TPA: lipopolysaccharide kinase InaA family protein [Candidatus Binataceae bacterium]|nr:lipopolysaccharide kinase InaA family protein [Candidatus Binataceae bacterium]
MRLPRGGSLGARLAAAHAFVRLTAGPYQLHLRADLASHAGALATRLPLLGIEENVGAGNRGGGFHLRLDGAPELFVRRARRGGAIRLVLDDLYVGLRPRPVRELAVTAEAARRGVPVAEPLGAAVRWVAPGVYRGFFMTRAISGMTLWEFVQTDDDSAVRAHVLQTARAAVETMLRCGLYHPDLNLHNLFVTPQGESFAMVILDLDKARLYRGPLRGYARRRIADRLLRSARKLDPAGRYLNAAALKILDLA